ncbi:MAG TPA: DUF885 domain-containing protein [Acidimicrobiia bacterium]|nr:DUF885 domain-containing protein [Acidimicrobiia bacterium]
MNTALQALADEYWEFVLGTIAPTTAMLIGDHRFDDRLEDVSRQAEDEQMGRLDDILARTEAIDPATLTSDEQVTRGVLLHEAAGLATPMRSRLAEFDVSPSTGIHIDFLQLVGQLPISTPDHAAAVTSKFSKMGRLFEQAVHRLRQGLATGRTPPQIAVEKVIAQIDAYLASPMDEDPFLNVAAPGGFTPEQEAAWRDELAMTVTSSIRPGYAHYREALATEVARNARPDERSGVTWLPDGADVYEQAIRRHTSLDMPALDIHRIGLDIIEQLGDEYRELGGRVLGTTDLDEIFSRLRNDPALRFSSRDEIVAAAQSALDRAAAAMPEWFGRLPRAECRMAEIPGPGAEEAPLAYYFPPATDGSRPGQFFINTTEPTTRTRFESEALAFHESIPGHHLQLAIAQELDGMPEFRKHAIVNAYVEGWGLYTERLADEMGLYTDDTTRLGMLSFDSWRAGRLVVDTGIHALGWSRREAIEWMVANTPQAPNNIEAEVDRYIGWPGQALGYMIGRREIDRLRSEAEQRMAGSFDIRGFHDAVLGSGPVPLDILDDLVTAWAKS